MLHYTNSSFSSPLKQRSIRRIQTFQFKDKKESSVFLSQLKSFKSIQTNEHNTDIQPLNLDHKSNQIILIHDPKFKNHFLIPYYMRLKIKDVSKISYQQSTAIMNATLIINIDTTGLPKRFIKKIRSKLALQINRCEQLKIKQSNQIQIAQQNQPFRNFQITQLKITIRKEFQVGISKQFSYILLSPFEKLVLIASFTLNSIYFHKNSIKVSFNSMEFMKINLKDKDIITKIEQDQHIIAKLLREIEYQYFPHKDWIKSDGQKQLIIKKLVEKRKRLFINRFLKCQTDKQSLQIYLKSVRLELQKDVTSGDYQISKRLFGIHDTKENYLSEQNFKNIQKADQKKTDKTLDDDVKKFREITQNEQKNSQFKKFEHTHFYFTLYSNPFPSIFTILIPNIFLGLISLVVFIFKLSLIQRTSIIATLLLGFIQLLPSMKQQTIDKESLSIVQIITYINTFMCFVSLFDSFHLHQSLLEDVELYDYIDLQTKLETGFKLSQLWPENGYFVFCVIVNVALIVIIFASIAFFKIYERKYLMQPQNYHNAKKYKWEVFKYIKNLIIFYIKKGVCFIKCRLGNAYTAPQQDIEETQNYLKYSDQIILSKFLKIPLKYSLKWSLFWTNSKCDHQLQKFDKKNKNKGYRPISRIDLSPLQ